MRETVKIEPTDVRSESFADLMADYPFPHEVDSIDELPWVVCVADDTGTPFTARVLGFGSSYRETHKDHAPGVKPARGTSCSRCRWTDTAILESDSGQFVFVSMGKSSLEGEWQRDTVLWAEDAADVLRECFVPTKASFARDTGAKAISPQNADAFRQAAAIHPDFAALLERYEAVIPEVKRADEDPLAGL